MQLAKWRFLIAYCILVQSAHQSATLRQIISGQQGNVVEETENLKDKGIITI